MATTTAQLDTSGTRERVLDIVRGLLVELGSQGALPMLTSASLLDRDLGLGSLERVELLARLETEFGVRLPDRVAAEANTPEDLTRAIVGAPGAGTIEDEAPSALRASVTAQKLARETSQAGAFSAETLLDVLRYRAKHDADRAHLLITEEDADGKERDLTLTFGELYAAAQRCAARTCAPRRPRRWPRLVDAARPPARSSFPTRAFFSPARFPCRSIRRFARTASKSTPRANPPFSTTRKSACC